MAYGAFWLVTGALAVLGVRDFGSSQDARFMGLLMLGNGTALCLAGWLVFRGRRLADRGALLLALLNALLSITDDLGLLDLAALIMSLLLVGLVLMGRRSIMPRA